MSSKSFHRLERAKLPTCRFITLVLAALGLVLSLVLWGTLVAPVNAEWLRVMESAPMSVPEAYLQLRLRWEYGHVAAFAAWLAGFSLLVLSVLIETPADRSRDHAA